MNHAFVGNLLPSAGVSAAADHVAARSRRTPDTFSTLNRWLKLLRADGDLLTRRARRPLRFDDWRSPLRCDLARFAVHYRERFGRFSGRDPARRPPSLTAEPPRHG